MQSGFESKLSCAGGMGALLLPANRRSLPGIWLVGGDAPWPREARAAGQAAGQHDASPRQRLGHVAGEPGLDVLGHRLPRFQLEPLPGWDGGLGEVLQVEGPADKGRPWWRHRVLRSPAGPAAARRARAGKFGHLHGVLRLPFGTGRHAPVAGVDQSYVIAAILENSEPHDRQAYPL